jgi:hypothetical protein
MVFDQESPDSQVIPWVPRLTLDPDDRSRGTWSSTKRARTRKSLRGTAQLSQENHGHLPMLPMELQIHILEYALTSKHPIIDPLSKSSKEALTSAEKTRGNRMASGSRLPRPSPTPLPATAHPKFPITEVDNAQHFNPAVRVNGGFGWNVNQSPYPVSDDSRPRSPIPWIFLSCGTYGTSWCSPCMAIGTSRACVQAATWTEMTSL